MKRPNPVTLILISCCCAIAAQAADSVVAKLTPEEFKAAGLHKLSAPEIAALDAALQRQTAVTPPKRAPEPTREALFGAETLPAGKAAVAPTSIRTRIVGRFDGWTGKTVFALENGQRWQQRIPDTYVAPRSLESPEVVLERGSFGYRLVIVELRHQVPVKRIQ